MHNMKRLILLIAFATCCLGITTNCSSKDNGNGGNTTTTLATQLTASKWKVHYFFYLTDQTKQLGDYVFTFKSDSTVSVTNNIDTYSGGWYTKKDNSGTQFITINVRTLTIAQLLNSDWKVLSNDGSLLQLKETTNGTNADLHLIKQ